ncbi:MAG: hypothetical protein JSV86_21015 [Gemmatimonadota bacterium]|nr:MAG: hypothetical protein JSV86_21015 [Gemmatimonadota bacterium]
MASDLRTFLAELKRRRVYRVAAVYAAVAFVIWQAADFALPALRVPDWVSTLIVVLTLIGFPIAVVLAWAFEITAEGVKRTEPLTAGGEAAGSEARAGRFALAIVVIVVAVGALWMISRYSGPRVEREPTAIAVLPFSVHGSDEFAYLGSGMVDLLSRKLDGAGEYRKIDPHTLLGFVGRQGYTSPGPDEGRVVAERFGAGLYVLGNVVEAGGRLEVSATLYDDAGNVQVEAAATAADESEIFDVVDELARQLLAREFTARGERLTGIAALTTSSVTAFKEYVEGETAFRRGDHLHSLEALGRAVAADTGFALAYYWRAIAAAYVLDFKLTREEVGRALDHRERLGEHERHIVDALAAWLRGEAEEPERLLRAVVRAYPEDIAAWHLLGETLYHHNPLRGRPITESREAWERMLAVDPYHVSALEHLWSFAALEATMADTSVAILDSLAERYLTVDPDGPRALMVSAVQAAAHDDPVAQTRLLAEAAGASDAMIFNTAWPLAVVTSDHSYAMGFAGLLAEPEYPAGVRALGHVYRAYIELSRGRWGAASQELEAAARFDGVAALENRALFAAAPFLPISRQELEEVLMMFREPLRDADSTVALGSFLGPHRGYHESLRTYLLGILSARLGEAGAALESAARLEAATGPELAPAAPRNLAKGIRARITWERGDPAETVQVLEQARMAVPTDLAWPSPFFSHGHERFLRAEALKSLGRDEEALGWYSSLPGVYSPFDVIYMAPAHFSQAEIYERLGERESAAAHYARVVELWQDCDPELRPLVEESERRLAELRRR